MNQEFIPVELRQDRVQMHKGPAARNIHGQHTADGAVLVHENIPRQTLHRLRHGPLGNTDGDRVRAQVHDVAALQREGLLGGVIEGHLPGKIGMIVQDIITVDRFSIARHGIHMMQGNAVSDAGKGVARKIEVGDRLQNEVRAVAAQRGKAAAKVLRQLVKADADHGLEHQLAVVRDAQQQLGQSLAVAVSHAAAAVNKVVHKLTAQGAAAGNGLCHQLRKIQNLYTALAQNVRKTVVLRLCSAQIRDVVEQQARHGIGGELFQLASGPVQQHGLKPADLTFHVNGHVFPSGVFFYSTTEDP